MSINVSKLPRAGVYLYVMCFMGRPHEPLGPVKIGITGNVQTRLSSVQTGCHRRLEVLAAFSVVDRDSARELEREMHKMALNWRLEGEWFDLDPILALENTCALFRLFLYRNDMMFPEDTESLHIEMGRVGLMHFEMQVEELRRWRAHYAEKSNVTSLVQSK